jgi:hypothetical protein
VSDISFIFGLGEDLRTRVVKDVGGPVMYRHAGFQGLHESAAKRNLKALASNQLAGLRTGAFLVEGAPELKT